MNKTTWQRVKLGEVGKITTGKTPSQNNPQDWGGEMLFVTPSDYKNYYKYAKNSIRKISKEGKARFKNTILPKNSILVTCIGSDMGKVAINYEECLTNQQINSITPNSKILYNFLYYHMVFLYPVLKNLGSSGTAVPILNKSDFENIEISLPPLETQHKIAEILSSLDDKIDLLHRQNKTLESLSLTLFRHSFIENPKRNEWEEKPLSEIAEIKIGRTPPRKEKQWFSTDSKNAKWISIKDMEKKIFIFNTSEFLTAEAINKFKIPIIPPKTIILSFKMTLGRVGITTENMLSNEAIAHFNLYDKYEHFTEYLYLFLKTFKYETLGSTSSIVTAINTSLIKNIKIAIPDKTTLNDFQIQAKGFFDKIYNNSKQIQNLETLRDIMLPKLLSGKMEV